MSDQSQYQHADGENGRAVAIHDSGISHPLIHKPGIYFGLPEEEYHEALALSASGVKWLRVSPLDWWSRSPLNPELEDEEESEAFEIGRAYHKRIIEGPDAFYENYAPSLDPRDFSSALRTNEELVTAISAAGGPIKIPKGTRKADLIQMLRRYDRGAMIWDEISTEHKRHYAGKKLLPAKLMKRIEIAAAMIERHPQLCKAFTGGYPEVSIFWIDQETGVPCKSRLDFLKPKAIVDLKTFDPRGIQIDRAIARAFATYKYNIQSAVYLIGAEQARQFARDGIVYGAVDAEFVAALAAQTEFTFLFVWQAKGLVPVAKGKVLARGNVLDIGRMEFHESAVKFARCWEVFGTEPWIETYDIETWDDTDFPVYLTE